MGKWWGAPGVGMLLAAAAAQGASCALGWSYSTMSIWVSDDPGVKTQAISNDWAIGVKCSTGDSTVCRATFAESLWRQDPVTGQYNWVMGMQGNPVPLDCGSQPRIDSGKIHWSYWPDGNYRFLSQMTQAGAGGQVIYSGWSTFTVPGA
jgi:hypothetical protein